MQEKLVNKKYLNTYLGIVILMAVATRFSFINENAIFVLSSIFMPMVFIYTGAKENVFFIDNQKKDADFFTKYAFKEYLIPYLWFSLLYTTVDSLLFIVKRNVAINLIYSDILNSLTLYGISILWYLPALFLAVTIYFISRKKLPYFVRIIIASILLGLALYLFADVNKLLQEADTLFKEIIIKLFIMTHRTVLAYFYMIIGEGIDRLTDAVITKKLIIAVSGFICTGAGIIAGYFNKKSDISILALGNISLFFLATILSGVGIFLLSKWIGRTIFFDFLGVNARIIYLTHFELFAIAIGSKVETIVLDIFVNYFLSHLMNILVVIIIVTIYIVVINKFFYFAVAKEANNTFGLNEIDDND